MNEETKDYEITIIVRDSQGKPTTRTRSFATNSPYSLAKFWYRNQPVVKNKNKNKTAVLPDAKEAEKILASMYKG
jgi:hypothetical protein